MYELYDPCTVMFFFRNKHIMIDLGTGNNNKISWAFNNKQEVSLPFEKMSDSVAGAFTGKVLTFAITCGAIGVCGAASSGKIATFSITCGATGVCGAASLGKIAIVLAIRSTSSYLACANMRCRCIQLNRGSLNTGASFTATRGL